MRPPTRTRLDTAGTARGSIIAAIIEAHAATKNSNEPSSVATPMSITSICRTAMTQAAAASPKVSTSGAAGTAVLALVNFCGTRRRSLFPARRRCGAELHEAGTIAVRLVRLVVPDPPLVRCGLRVALWRVLPLLLAPERGDVQVVPGVPHLLVAAGVDEVGAEDAVAVADEGVRAVPLIHAEVGVEVVRDRVPGDVLPAHPRLQALDVRLRRARGEREARVALVQVGGMSHLVRDHRAADAGMLGPPVDAALEEGAVDDELGAAVEEVDQAELAVRPFELVFLLHRQPRLPPTLRGQRIPGAHQLRLLHERALARSLPLLCRHDRGRVHLETSLSLISSRAAASASRLIASKRSSQRAATLASERAAASSCWGRTTYRTSRPCRPLFTRPARSRTARCLATA